MSQAFYRKWRSQDFNELVGQEHVTKTLLGALRTGRISHAYLFCGPRGTGKTSTARILAKAVNCQTNEGRGDPCNTCPMCLAITDGRAIDLIEMDAASNRGIDDIRELRDRVNFAPNEARYKIYIIDEVHQLTPAAFDALLKTLEEPPRHVIFVLATTEAHEVPATILSRCQRFDFRRISVAAATARLDHICAREGIAIDPAALQMIVRTAGGSLRDAENLLDQVASFYGDTIDVAQVRETLGIPDAELVRSLVAQILDRDVAGGLHTINEVANCGEDLRHFGKQLVGYLRNVLLIKAGADKWADLPVAELEDLKELAGQVSLAEAARLIKVFGFSETKLDDLSTLPLELALVEALSGPAEGVGAPRPTSNVQRPDVRAPGAGGDRLPIRRVAAEARAPDPIRPEVAVIPRPAAANGAAGHSAEEESIVIAAMPDLAPAAQSPAVAEAAPPDAGATGTFSDPAPSLGDETIAPAPAAAAVGAPAATLAPSVAPGDGALSVEDVRLSWSQIVAHLKPRNGPQRSVQALLRSDLYRIADVRDGEIWLAFRYDMHRQKVEEADSRRFVEKSVAAVLGVPLKIVCGPDTETVGPDKLEMAQGDPMVQAIIRQGGRLNRVT